MKNTREKTRSSFRWPAGRRSIIPALRPATGGLGDPDSVCDAPRSLRQCPVGTLRRDLVGRSVLVAVEGETVDHECVAEEVEVLAGVAAAVGASDPESVDKVSVDRFSVVPTRVETREVRVGGRDGPDVFGPVETTGTVGVGAVQAVGAGNSVTSLTCEFGWCSRLTGSLCKPVRVARAEVLLLPTRSVLPLANPRNHLMLGNSSFG